MHRGTPCCPCCPRMRCSFAGGTSELCLQLVQGEGSGESSCSCSPNPTLYKALRCNALLSTIESLWVSRVPHHLMPEGCSSCLMRQLRRACCPQITVLFFQQAGLGLDEPLVAAAIHREFSQGLRHCQEREGSEERPPRVAVGAGCGPSMRAHCL